MIKPILKKGVCKALGLSAFFVFAMTFFSVNTIHAQDRAVLSQQVANADRDLADQFEAEAEVEIAEVRSNPDFSNEEKIVREKLLRASVKNVRAGLEISDAFDAAYTAQLAIVNNYAPGLNFKSILQEYKNQFS